MGLSALTGISGIIPSLLTYLRTVWSTTWAAAYPSDSLVLTTATITGLPTRAGTRSVPAGAYYVDRATGDDTRSAATAQVAGTPWKTLDKAVDTASTGSTIVVRGGTYNASTDYLDAGAAGNQAAKLTSSKHLTIQAYPGETVIYRGDQTITGWTHLNASTAHSGNTFAVETWYTTFTPNLKWAKANRYPHESSGNLVFLNGTYQQELFKSGEEGVGDPEISAYLIANMGAGKYYVDQTDDFIYLGSDPTAATVQACFHERFIETSSGCLLELYDINAFVFGCQLQQEVVKIVDSPSSIVKGCNVQWSAAGGIGGSTANDGGYTPTNSSSADGALASIEANRDNCANLLIENNVVAWCGHVGVSLSCASGTVVKSNLIAYSNWFKYVSDSFESGNKFSLCNGIVYIGNHIHHFIGGGIWSDVQCRSSRALYNRVHDGSRLSQDGTTFDSGNGIHLELEGTHPTYGRSLVFSNLVYRCGIGIFIAETNGAIVANNIVAQCNRNIRIAEATSSTNRVRHDEVGTADGECYNTEIYGNASLGTLTYSLASNLATNYHVFVNDNRGSGTRRRADAMISRLGPNLYWNPSAALTNLFGVQESTSAQATVPYTTPSNLNATYPTWESGALYDSSATDPVTTDAVGLDFSIKRTGQTGKGVAPRLPSWITVLAGFSRKALRSADYGALHLPLLATTTYVLDTYTRTVTAGWGSADTGGPYTTTGTAANANVNGTQGTLSIAAGGNITESLAITQQDVDAQAMVKVDGIPTAGSATSSVVVRRVDANDQYRFSALWSVGGSITAQIVRVLAGTPSTLASSSNVVTGMSAGQSIHIRGQAEGVSPTTLRIRIWKDGDAEPATWQVTTTDSSAAMQTALGVALRHQVAGSTTPTPIIASFDDFGVTSL